MVLAAGDDGDDDDASSDKSSVSGTTPTSPTGPPSLYPPAEQRQRDGDRKPAPKSFLHNKGPHLNNNNASDVSGVSSTNLHHAPPSLNAIDGRSCSCAHVSEAGASDPAEAQESRRGREVPQVGDYDAEARRRRRQASPPQGEVRPHHAQEIHEEEENDRRGDSCSFKCVHTMFHEILWALCSQKKPRQVLAGNVAVLVTYLSTLHGSDIVLVAGIIDFVLFAEKIVSSDDPSSRYSIQKKVGSG